MEESIILKKSIGILYICTGPYKLFWEDFYNSFEKFFLPEYEKHYYVFSDAEENYFGNDFNRIHCYRIDNQPWPLVTLLRFGTFLKQEEKLKQHELIMFSNSNIVCCDYIKTEEILPNIEAGEQLFFTCHPGYYKKRPWNTPLERNRKSKAYVPYHMGKSYVIGALFGGYADAFLDMSHLLNERIAEDLKKGVIAIWHDESHINHYVVTHENYRIINPGYCYPVGFDVPFEKRITGVPKANVFDVNRFKGYYTQRRYTVVRCIWMRMYNATKEKIGPYAWTVRDFLLQRKVAK